MLTENGRQPWIVQGLMQTSQGVSPSVSAASIWISLSVFVLLYGTLAVVDWALMVRYARKELAPVGEADEHDLSEPAMAY
jgi:cytochrome bd-type quinol oxidase subunit 1